MTKVSPLSRELSRHRAEGIRMPPISLCRSVFPRTHAAYGSIRMEPVFMMLRPGCAAIAAVRKPSDNNLPVQKVAVDQDSRAPRAAAPCFPISRSKTPDLRAGQNRQPDQSA